MANPFLPLWEYIPDGEPRVFGDRVYVYGSHDNAGVDTFCDYKLKVWSAPLDNLNLWQCHGDSFHTKADRDHSSSIDWSENQLYAPDVVEKDGKYYLYAYIVDAKGCVAVSDTPEGPFTLLSQYEYPMPDDLEGFDKGIFVDPGVLVDDDGKVYIYCGFLSSYMAEINPDNMYEILEGSFQKDIIPVEEPFAFFEACSLRKIGDTYYMIYSPKRGSCLAYATSKSPKGPFAYQGIIVDNGDDYPGGNDHGSICFINGEWYIFYHRMTNGTVFSRRACVEKIQIASDGTIPQVKMTSLGFESALNPYKETQADIACVLKEGAYVVQYNEFERTVANIQNGCIIGYRYFDFGEDNSSETMEFVAKIRGTGCRSRMRIVLDDYENGVEIGTCEIGMDNHIYKAVTKNVTGYHALFFLVEDTTEGWGGQMLKGRQLFELESFLFMK
ncbi:family 43 glycosylhydrolase [Anaerosporobacter sp.]|uniref:family 43 glycosylhydrolase n=1 Tax=Anaerosporobacter sp. TaxID=1872529 RepID=UPI00286EF9D8|nr:family 43 glycosylhydrolase [Anaerosporobacter sp.]